MDLLKDKFLFYNDDIPDGVKDRECVNFDWGYIDDTGNVLLDIRFLRSQEEGRYVDDGLHQLTLKTSGYGDDYKGWLEFRTEKPFIDMNDYPVLKTDYESCDFVQKLEQRGWKKDKGKMVLECKDQPCSVFFETFQMWLRGELGIAFNYHSTSVKAENWDIGTYARDPLFDGKNIDCTFLLSFCVGCYFEDVPYGWRESDRTHDYDDDVKIITDVGQQFLYDCKSEEGARDVLLEAVGVMFGEAICVDT